MTWIRVTYGPPPRPWLALRYFRAGYVDALTIQHLRGPRPVFWATRV